MLKVTILDGKTEIRIKVEGDLAGPSVRELESTWKDLAKVRAGRRVLVDLNETTAIDAGGKKILMVLASQGAELVAKGVYTEYVVKGLVERAHAGCRS